MSQGNDKHKYCTTYVRTMPSWALIPPDPRSQVVKAQDIDWGLNSQHNRIRPAARFSNVAWPRPLDPSSSSLGYPLGPRPVTARYLGASTGPWKAPRVVGSSSQPPSRPADRTQPSSGRASRGPLAGEHKHWIPMGLKQQRPGKLESSMTHRASKHGTGELQRPAEGPARAEGPVDTSNMEDQAVPAFASIIRHRAWQRRIDAT